MRVLRAIVLALLLSLLFGVAVGTLLRLRLERPVRYLGSAPASLPLDIGEPGPPILHPRHDEQQIG